MTFTTPWALLLLLPGAWVIWLGRPGRGAGRGRRRLALGVRLLSLTCLALALAGAQRVQRARAVAVVFLVDASASISPAQAVQAQEFMRQALAQLRPPDQAAVVVFGGEALVERPLSGSTEPAPLRSRPDVGQSDIAEAIRLGLALFPAGSARRLVLLSDGQATSGDTVAAARLAAAAGARLDYAPLARPPLTAEAWLEDVAAPARVSAGERLDVTATAASTVDQPATLRLLAAGSLVAEERVQLRPGVNQFNLSLRAATPGFMRLVVELDPSRDSTPQNNRLAAFSAIVGPSRVFLLASDEQPDEAAALTAALEGAGLSVTPGELSDDLAALSNYDSLILVDVNAKELSARQMSAIQSYVRDLGGGLLVVGGPHSYGVGGYFRTPLEETLPVNMQLKDPERFPSVSLALVIDRSGSMAALEGGAAKIQLAAEGAVRVVEWLNDDDAITVIPVDTQPAQVVGPMLAAERAQVIREIRAIGAGGGGIYVRTGLAAAADALAAGSQTVRHIILLADGADAEEQEGAAALAQELAAQGITLSVVAIGAGPDVPFLQNLARVGQGRFHFTDRAANLPQIFTQETSQIQRSYVVEERFFPQALAPSPILSGITSTPPLYGYVGTSAKTTAQVILATPPGDPLLAQWRYGLGRAVAWTSDATGRWGREWVTWPGFAPFWAQAVGWTISQGRGEALELGVTYGAESAVLTVEARDSANRFLNDLTLRANVVAPDGRTQTLGLTQSAPGRYSGAFTPTQEGAYLIRVAGVDADGQADGPAQTGGWVLGYAPEYRPVSADTPPLAALAGPSGGRDLSDNPAAVWARDLPAGRNSQPLWPGLVLLASLIWPLDIALRRLYLTRQDGVAWLRARLGRRAVAPPPSPARLERLLAARQRAAQPSAPPLPGEPPPPAASPPPASPESADLEAEPSAEPLSRRLLEQKRRRADQA